jgi:cell cycle checkpoint protein
MVTECSFSTLETYSDDSFDYEMEFRKHAINCKTVMRSDILHDILASISEDAANEVCLLYLSNSSAPFFRMHSYNNTGSVTVDVDKNSEAFVTFDVSKDIQHHYRVKLLSAMLRASANAQNSYLRINDKGVLSIAHKVLTDVPSVHMFINFTCLPDDPSVTFSLGNETSDAEY